jgi:hypothetical protein
MKPNQIEAFAEMVETIPPHAVIAALEWEIPILEKNLATQYPAPSADAAAILDLCRFVFAARRGMSVEFSSDTLPSQHREIFRKTVARLVKAEELPFSAKAEFDHIIFSNRRQLLSNV